MLPIAAFVLASASVGGVLFALFQPRFAGGSPLDRRSRRSRGRALPRCGWPRARPRRRASVRQVDAARGRRRQKGSERRKNKPSLAIRLRQADLELELADICCSSAGVGGRCSWLASIVGPVVAAVLGVAGGLLLPRLLCRLPPPPPPRALPHLFPDAMDVIVRGIKSACRWPTASRLSSEPRSSVKGETRRCRGPGAWPAARRARHRLPTGIPIPEASFFAIVIARREPHQRQPVGSARQPVPGPAPSQEDVGRDRSDERRGQGFGGIVGSLPIVVGGILYFTSPDYLGLLFNNAERQYAWQHAPLWMATGSLRDARDGPLRLLE